MIGDKLWKGREGIWLIILLLQKNRKVEKMEKKKWAKYIVLHFQFGHCLVAIHMYTYASPTKVNDMLLHNWPHGHTIKFNKYSIWN